MEEGEHGTNEGERKSGNVMTEVRGRSGCKYMVWEEKKDEDWERFLIECLARNYIIKGLTI